MILAYAWLGLMVVFLIFCSVLLVGAPYVPTLANSRRQALQLLDLKAGQTVYDLGCGDGSFLRAAASAGLKAVGYELNPILVVIAWWRTRHYRRQVKVRWGNFWNVNLAPADGVFVFLLDRFMPRLDAKLEHEAKPGLKLVSHAFSIPGRQPAAKRGSLFLYKYG